MRNFAQLDNTGLLTSFVLLADDAPDATAPPPNRVEVPLDCDLAVGKYRWDGAAFVPLAAGTLARLEEKNGVKAMALGLIAVRDSGLVTLPQYTLDWLDWYEQSFDFKG